jgi:catechol 2,3-dioxygenase-like lactoylglutathione lyase family enzyme
MPDESTHATGTASNPVLQLRLVVEVDDFDAAVAFYRGSLGLPQQAAFQGDGDARIVILDAGRATLEIVNSAQRAMIDQIEVGRDASPRIRVAFEVGDATGVVSKLVAAGATSLADPVVTPWHSLNARMDAPGGLQLTIFEELEPRGGG